MVPGAPKGQVLRLVPREGKALIALGKVLGFMELTIYCLSSQTELLFPKPSSFLHSS
jgi:hypothetical protein